MQFSVAKDERTYCDSEAHQIVNDQEYKYISSMISTLIWSNMEIVIRDRAVRQFILYNKSRNKAE